MSGGRRPSVLLVDTFYVDGKKQRVTLTTASISWEPESALECSLLRSIPLEEVVGAVPCDCSLERNKCQYCMQRRRPNRYRLTCSEMLPLQATSFRLCHALRSGPHRWKTRDIIFQSLVDGGVSREWLCAIHDTLRRLPQVRPQKLLVFVNPYGGKKAAPKLYKKKVLPLLLLAGMEVQTVETERANHARDFLQEIDLGRYDGIVCVGGDGMFGELLNGLLVRTQRDAGIDVNDTSAYLQRPQLALGVIPAGSTDAVVFGTTGVNDVVTSTLQIIMGHRVGVDVCSLHGHGVLLRYATSFLSYGFFGDTLVESEKHRWMGPARYDISGFKTFLKQKVYEGELVMEVVSNRDQPWKDQKCIYGCAVCSKAGEKTKQRNQEIQKNSRWVTLKGRFKAINVATISGRCEKSREGVSPTAHLGDGCTDMVLVGNCSARDYMRYLLRTALAYSSPFELEFVQFFRVRQFRFKPTSDSEEMYPIAGEMVIPSSESKQTSIWNCDGEVVTEPTVHAKVHCQLVNLFASGIEVRDEERCCGCCRFA